MQIFELNQAFIAALFPAILTDAVDLECVTGSLVVMLAPDFLLEVVHLRREELD